ncbi:MAG: hypothetical protein LBH53_00940 [Puniceicoccales bacterium]|nr:hypothetical protein [Puniceicoccales bacterium]
MNEAFGFEDLFEIDATAAPSGEDDVRELSRGIILLAKYGKAVAKERERKCEHANAFSAYCQSIVGTDFKNIFNIMRIRIPFEGLFDGVSRCQPRGKRTEAAGSSQCSRLLYCKG